jgi:hypothetical protein
MPVFAGSADWNGYHCLELVSASHSERLGPLVPSDVPTNTVDLIESGL